MTSADETMVQDYLQRAHARGGGDQMAMLMMAQRIERLEMQLEDAQRHKGYLAGLVSRNLSIPRASIK